jgi:Domain of Unknown Function (DUF1259)
MADRTEGDAGRIWRSTGAVRWIDHRLPVFIFLNHEFARFQTFSSSRRSSPASLPCCHRSSSCPGSTPRRSGARASARFIGGCSGFSSSTSSCWAGSGHIGQKTADREGQSGITGDFVLIAKEVNPVLRALRGNGIEIAALHGHMLDEQPRAFFMHFGANDGAQSWRREGCP